MSIESQLEDLQTNLTNAKSAIETKGGTVGDTGLAGLASEIAGIPSGGGGGGTGDWDMPNPQENEGWCRFVIPNDDVMGGRLVVAGANNETIVLSFGSLETGTFVPYPDLIFTLTTSTTEYIDLASRYFTDVTTNGERQLMLKITTTGKFPSFKEGTLCLRDVVFKCTSANTSIIIPPASVSTGVYLRQYHQLGESGATLGIWKDYFNNSNVYFIDDIIIEGTSSLTDFSSGFYRTVTGKMPKIDTSSGTKFYRMFGVLKLDTYDFSDYRFGNANLSDSTALSQILYSAKVGTFIIGENTFGNLTIPSGKTIFSISGNMNANSYPKLVIKKTSSLLSVASSTDVAAAFGLGTYGVVYVPASLRSAYLANAEWGALGENRILAIPE